MRRLLDSCLPLGPLLCAGLALIVASAPGCEKHANVDFGREQHSTAVASLAGTVEPEAPLAEAPLPERLSQTGLFVPDSLHVRPELLTFTPQYPLWTDGADKHRWIELPAKSSIDASNPDVWVFPVGTRIWKEFSFAGRRIETRYMERGTDGAWRYATYQWTEAQDDAIRCDKARHVPLASSRQHWIPAEVDCRSCHEGRSTPVLGFDLLQLSPDTDPLALHRGEPSRDEVDLGKLVRSGHLRGLPSRYLDHQPRIETANVVERAARGYLHGNCGYCHNAEGPLASLGMDLAFHSTDAVGARLRSSTIGRASRFALQSPTLAQHRVMPGDVDASVLSRRMHARDPITKMPPIGTTVTDDEALALIDLWIDSMPAVVPARPGSNDTRPIPTAHEKESP